MSLLREVAPDHPCDRCGHPSKRHAVPILGHVGSECLVVESPIPYTQRGRNLKAKQCFCDQYVTAP